MQDEYDELAPGVWTWLQAWYASQCNGEWEHEYGLAPLNLGEALHMFRRSADAETRPEAGR
ncbi:Immunity protein 53 [Micromonospora pattaloongensis]|uniref:Immunity protein 53 n=1 Tax=Micromonospora pattaloongensis TaxID=405436 RepID=A0A1H3QNF5_9ACTN|nr:Imm53 family immunity protein [Micromonospora pattaloongensis]SDZ15114.1 Immunity protein 53 [Micromonospora pattaloongensis]